MPRPRPRILFSIPLAVSLRMRRLKPSSPVCVRLFLLRVTLLSLLFLFLPSFLLPPTLLSPLPPALSAPPSPASPPSPSSWKQPSILAAHATPLNASHLSLALISTGVDTQSFGRVFTPVACLLSRTHAFPPSLVQPGLVICPIRRSALLPTTSLTLVLRNDAALRDALTGPQSLRGEVFALHPGDVEPLREDNPHLLLHSARLRSQLRREGGPGLAFIRSTVVWSPALLDAVPLHAPHFELCLMTTVRQNPFLLPSWIAYYRRMGIDQVFVYDNGSLQNLASLVANWMPFVQIVPWPWPRSQMQSNNHFLLASKSRCRFVAFFDVDEYVMIGAPSAKVAVPPGAASDGDEKLEPVDNEDLLLRGTPLLKRYVLLRRSQGYDQIFFQFLPMVNSGYVRRPKGHLPELYVHRAPVHQMSYGKMVIDTEQAWIYHKIHAVKGRGLKTYQNMTMELSPDSIKHNAMLVHYRNRSWEDFVVKNSVDGRNVMTAGRHPEILDVGKPDPLYMNEVSVKFEGFLNRWKEVMRNKDSDTLILTWKALGGARCRSTFCPKCLSSMRLGPPLCTSSSSSMT